MKSSIFQVVHNRTLGVTALQSAIFLSTVISWASPLYTFFGTTHTKRHWSEPFSSIDTGVNADADADRRSVTAACVGSGFPKQPNLYEPTSEVYPPDFVSNWVEPLIKFRNNSSDNSFGSTGPPSF